MQSLLETPNQECQPATFLTETEGISRQVTQVTIQEYVIKQNPEEETDTISTASLLLSR